ncbi:MAG: hypothetical protein ACQES9_05285 [Myxococcota bacterium]
MFKFFHIITILGIFLTTSCKNPSEKSEIKIPVKTSLEMHYKSPQNKNNKLSKFFGKKYLNNKILHNFIENTETFDLWVFPPQMGMQRTIPLFAFCMKGPAKSYAYIFLSNLFKTTVKPAINRFFRIRNSELLGQQEFVVFDDGTKFCLSSQKYILKHFYNQKNQNFTSDNNFFNFKLNIRSFFKSKIFNPKTFFANSLWKKQIPEIKNFIDKISEPFALLDNYQFNLNFKSNQFLLSNRLNWISIYKTSDYFKNCTNCKYPEIIARQPITFTMSPLNKKIFLALVDFLKTKLPEIKHLIPIINNFNNLALGIKLNNEAKIDKLEAYIKLKSTDWNNNKSLQKFVKPLCKKVSFLNCQTIDEDSIVLNNTNQQDFPVEYKLMINNDNLRISSSNFNSDLSKISHGILNFGITGQQVKTLLGSDSQVSETKTEKMTLHLASGKHHLDLQIKLPASFLQFLF